MALYRQTTASILVSILLVLFLAAIFAVLGVLFTTTTTTSFPANKILQEQSYKLTKVYEHSSAFLNILKHSPELLAYTQNDNNSYTNGTIDPALYNQIALPLVRLIQAMILSSNVDPLKGFAWGGFGSKANPLATFSGIEILTRNSSFSFRQHVSGTKGLLIPESQVVLAKIFFRTSDNGGSRSSEYFSLNGTLTSTFQLVGQNTSQIPYLRPIWKNLVTSSDELIAGWVGLLDISHVPSVSCALPSWKEGPVPQSRTPDVLLSTVQGLRSSEIPNLFGNLTTLFPTSSSYFFILDQDFLVTQSSFYSGVVTMPWIYTRTTPDKGDPIMAQCAEKLKSLYANDKNFTQSYSIQRCTSSSLSYFVGTLPQTQYGVTTLLVMISSNGYSVVDGLIADSQLNLLFYFFGFYFFSMFWVWMFCRFSIQRVLETVRMDIYNNGKGCKPADSWISEIYELQDNLFLFSTGSTSEEWRLNEILKVKVVGVSAKTGMIDRVLVSRSKSRGSKAEGGTVGKSSGASAKHSKN